MYIRFSIEENMGMDAVLKILQEVESIRSRGPQDPNSFSTQVLLDSGRVFTLVMTSESKKWFFDLGSHGQRFRELFCELLVAAGIDRIGNGDSLAVTFENRIFTAEVRRRGVPQGSPSTIIQISSVKSK